MGTVGLPASVLASVFLVVEIPNLHFYTYALPDSEELCNLLVYMERHLPFPPIFR